MYRRAQQEALENPIEKKANAIREWAEVNYLPSDGIWKKDAASPRRYLAIRIRPHY
jgi:hypothetical protein